MKALNLLVDKTREREEEENQTKCSEIIILWWIVKQDDDNYKPQRCVWTQESVVIRITFQAKIFCPGLLPLQNLSQ